MFFSYEKFCSNPSHIINEIARELEEIKYCSPEQKIKVKDYPASIIENMNDRQISKLQESELKIISSVLEKNQDVLEYFECDLLR